jgi:alkylation response protein AidB-like acyl-CoA dehydrogenase
MVDNLSVKQQELQQAAIAFARANLGQRLSEQDHTASFDRDGWRRCADFGLFAMAVPEEYGGLEMGLVDLIAVMEGLGYGTSDNGLLFSAHAHLWATLIPIIAFGSESQKQRFIPPMIKGELIGANAMTEPDSGSDACSISTRAERSGSAYLLNGTKAFVTNAPVADLFVVYATIDPSLGATGITAFLVERSTSGLVVGKPWSKTGLRTSPMAELVLEDCSVPSENRLGREGRGLAVFECSMEWERGCILASCLGSMRRMLEECVEYARTRNQFGQPIGKFQSVANRLVDMKVRLETCRPLVYRIGELKDAGLPARAEAAIAKLYVSECYVATALDAMRTLGGYGYTTEFFAERELRDALGSLFYSGTSDIQRNIIARELGL